MFLRRLDLIRVNQGAVSSLIGIRVNRSASIVTIIGSQQRYLSAAKAKKTSGKIIASESPTEETEHSPGKATSKKSALKKKTIENESEPSPSRVSTASTTAGSTHTSQPAHVQNVTIQSEAEKQQKRDALAIALAKIDKQFGKGTVSQLGSQPFFDYSRVIPTGALAVDDALGCGGLPQGRIVEIFGPEASGKTSLALAVIAEAQKRGGKCMFVDAEHALDPEYAKGMGVSLNDLYITQPDSGEDALEIVDNVVRSGAMSVIVVVRFLFSRMSWHFLDYD